MTSPRKLPPGEPSRLDDQAIDAMAAEWLAWRDTGLSAQQAEAFASWRAADPRHDDAIRRMEATQTLLARLPETPGAAAMYAELDSLCATHRQRVWRRNVVRVSFALAAAATLAVAFWLPQRGTSPTAVYTTAAEMREPIGLPDGSTVALRANSEVQVDFKRHERRLDLNFGEAHFAVAKDHVRPFIVSVGPVNVQATGTAFTIRRTASDVDVVVTEGTVRVTRHDSASDGAHPLAPLDLAAGERARIPTAIAAGDSAAGLQSFVVGNDGPAGTTELVFANTPLAEAVERFNRHSRLQMEIADPALRPKALGGKFNATNAEAFIALLIASGEIAVERVSETRVILRAVPALPSAPPP